MEEHKEPLTQYYFCSSETNMPTFQYTSPPKTLFFLRRRQEMQASLTHPFYLCFVRTWPKKTNKTKNTLQYNILRERGDKKVRV